MGCPIWETLGDHALEEKHGRGGERCSLIGFGRKGLEQFRVQGGRVVVRWSVGDLGP